MNMFKHQARNQICLTALLILAQLPGLLAQGSSIVITNPGTPSGDYKIGVTALNSNDLVFYRFSDGVDASAMNSPGNPQATVLRKFQQTDQKVSAFIARKNGPIELVTSNINNLACTSCMPPAAPNPSVSIRASWDPSVSPVDPLADPTTQPVCHLPSSPWFFLCVKITGPTPASSVDIALPAGMTLAGAIVKDAWADMPVPGSYTLNDPEVHYINCSANNANIKLTQNVGPNSVVTVYLIMKSSTSLGEQSNFSAQLYDAARKPVGSPSQLRVVTQTNPHDPNNLIPFQTTVCSMVSSQSPLTYRVNFQNLGDGVAQNVLVRIQINTQIIDPTSQISVTSSHPFSGASIGANFVNLYFNNINLPGIDNHNQFPLDLTKGWVELTVDAQPCIPRIPASFTTVAYVTFFGGNGFSETITTNQTTQLLRTCEPDPYCRDNEQDPGGGTIDPGGSEPGGTGHGKERAMNVQANSPLDAPSFKCYPSLFDDFLQIEASAEKENSTLRISVSDLTGRVWDQKTYQTQAGVATQQLLDTSALPAGMYLVQVSAGNAGKLFKVIKQ